MERESRGFSSGYPELRAEINMSAIGDNVLIAGITDQRIRIYTLVMWAQAACVVVLKDGALTINGAGFNFPAMGGGVFDFPNRPLTMALGNAFIINTSTTGPLTGWAEYTQVG